VPLTELQPGDPEQIGPYRLMNRLGSGGMGRVYLGRSRGGRLVAVKVISPELAGNADFRVRFAREAAAAHQVGGLYTAEVVDWSVDGAMPWLATAFVRGPSLEEAVAGGGPLKQDAVLDLAAGLAEGLAAIHAAGVVHRDLKPTNVILAEDGPRVIDFGIARSADDTALTRTGQVIGSPVFMSPEQAEGREVGPASDIFSLGSVLAFAAAGRPPFGSDRLASLLYQIVHREPDLDQVPNPLRALIGRCLAKDPADRPTAEQLLVEVARCREGITQPALADSAAAVPRPDPDEEPGEPARTVTVVAPPDTPKSQPLPSAAIPGSAARRRTRVLLGSAVVAVLALVAGLLAWTLPGSAPSPPRPPTGLAAAGATASSVALRWTRPVGGTAPDHYLISQDGKFIRSVPASVTDYRVTGLAPGSAYTYRIFAQTGSRRSGPSAVLRIHTLTPPLSAATLAGGWQGSYTVTSESGFSAGTEKGSTIGGAWRFVPGCAVGPCPATLYGSIGIRPFTVHLTDTDATYTGSASMRYAACHVGANRYVYTDQLSVQIAVSKAALVNRTWAASSWNGVMTLSAPGMGECNPLVLAVSFSSVNPTVRFSSAGPVVSSVSPSTASPGQLVTVRGADFGATQGLGYVTFSDAGLAWGTPGDTATFTVDDWSDDAITFTVPTPSGTGGEWSVVPGTAAAITVTTADGGISDGGTLNISFSSVDPAARSVSPGTASAGQEVTLRGVNFGASRSIGYVTFSDGGTVWGTLGDPAALRIDHWSDDAIIVTVPTPSGARGEWHVVPGTTATITVTTADGEISNPGTLIIGSG
jgi:hypothetical protein